MKKSNIVISFVFILLGILVLLNVSTYPTISVGNEKLLGPAFFPGLLAMILIVLSILLILTNYKSTEQRSTGLFDSYSIKAYITMLGLVVYILLLNVVGFLIMTPILLFALIRFYGVKEYPKLVITSLLITVFIYIVFKILLAVPLPLGILG